MTEPADPPQPGPDWRKRVIVTGCVVVLLIVAGFLGAAFVPRWWAHRIGAQVGGSIGAGIALGLFYGVVFTGLPLGVLRFAFHKRRRLKTWGIFFGIAIVLALPNLLTLGVVLGSGNAAHAAERTLDVDAPGYRGSVLAGAIIAALGFVAFEYFSLAGRINDRRMAKLKARLDEREAELAARDRAAGGSPPASS